MNDDLDILTEAGQKTVADEKRCAAIFESNFRDSKYISTPKDQPADVDATIVKHSAIIGVVEQKSRYGMTVATLMRTWHGEWLVTADKLDRARAVSFSLRVPLWGFLFVVDDDVLLIQQITRNDGEWSVPIRRERTTTQRTVNGGTATRLNAFIDMSAARTLKFVSDPTQQDDWIVAYERIETIRW